MAKRTIEAPKITPPLKSATRAVMAMCDYIEAKYLDKWDNHPACGPDHQVMGNPYGIDLFKRVGFFRNLTALINPKGDTGTEDFVTIRFTANLLDYTVDETTGDLVDGSMTHPVKFDEEWTWARPAGTNDWKLEGITVVEE